MGKVSNIICIVRDRISPDANGKIQKLERKDVGDFHHILQHHKRRQGKLETSCRVGDQLPSHHLQDMIFVLWKVYVRILLKSRSTLTKGFLPKKTVWLT